MNKKSVMPDTKRNLLRGTRCYLPGSMEYTVDGHTWRDIVEKELANRGIKFFNPYKKPYVYDTPEDDSSREEMLHWMETEQYDLVTQRIKKIRGEDLRCCDLADWFICRITPKIASWGTAEELSVIVREHKPIFLVIDDPRGKKSTPLWILSMVPHKYIYDTLGDVIKMVKAIDENIVKMNSNKWRLLREEFR